MIDRGALAQALHSVWPLLTPEVLVRRLLASPRRIENAGRDILTTEEVDALCAANEASDGWTEADVALLDEADLLLGPVPTRRQRAGGRRPSLDHVAERILEERLPDCPRCGRALEYRPGEASGTDRLECRECKVRYATTTLMGDSAANELHGVYEELAHQFASDEVTAIRPADARYGHVVVDEAQDLSPMQWRAVARRCPSQSFTLAGDEAQAVRAGSAATWDRILAALDVAEDSVTRHELTVNYRTPAEVMERGRPGCSSGSHRTCTRPAPSGLRESVLAASTPMAGRSARQTSRPRLPTSGARSARGWWRWSHPTHLVADGER